MKYLTLLALLPFLALSYQPAAEAKKAGAMPIEDGLALPWADFVRDAQPDAATKLLATVRVGTRLDSFHVSLANCGSDIRAVDFKVQGANVTVQSFGLKFTDGNTREFNVNKTFNAGSDSGWIDLGLFRSMDQRCPTEVFAKAQASGSATVLVYGDMR